MRITTNELSQAFIKFLQTDVMQKANSFQQGVVYFVLLQGSNSINKLFERLNLLSNDGYFDSNELLTNLTKALEKMGGSYCLPVIDYNLDIKDLNKIFSYIESR